MSRVEAAVEDLGHLAAEWSNLDLELTRWPAQLATAFELARATCASVMAPDQHLDAQLAAQLRLGASLVDATTMAARRLAHAGSDGALAGLRHGPLTVVPRGSWLSPSGRLHGHLAVAAAAQATGRRWGGFLRAFSGGRPAPVAHVVRTRTEIYGAELLAEGSLSLVWEDLSDGTVRVSAVQNGSAEMGIGVGTDLTARLAGVELSTTGGRAGASVGLNGAMVLVWSFEDHDEAQGWWDRSRGPLLASGLLPFGGIVGRAAIDRMAGALGRQRAVPPSEEGYVEIGLTGMAGVTLGSTALGDLMARLPLPSAEGRASATIVEGRSLRIHQNGSHTLVLNEALAASAEGRVGLASATTSADARADLNATFEITADASGELQGVTVRSVFYADPGFRPTLRDALLGHSASASAGAALHRFESTVSLDLTDPASRAMISSSLEVDLANPADQVRVALAAVSFDAATIVASHVQIIERGPLSDDTTSVGATIELGKLDVGAQVTFGTTTQDTEAAWHKPPGSLEVLRWS